MHRPARLLAALSLAAATAALAGCATADAPGGPTPTSAVEENSSLAAQVPADLAGKTLVLAGPADAAPSVYKDENGDWKGWEVELAEDTAKVLGVKLSIQGASFDTIIPGLQSGKFDLAVSTISINDDRIKQVDFVQTSVFGQAFAAKKDLKGTYDSVESLAGLRVATAKGNTAALKVEAANEELQAAGKKTIDSLEFPTNADAQQALLSDRADVYFVGELPLQYFISQHSDDIKIVGRVGETQYDTPGGHGTAFTKGSGLAEVWAKATQDLVDDGTVAALQEEYGVGGLESKVALVNPADSDFDPTNPDNVLSELGISAKG